MLYENMLRKLYESVGKIELMIQVPKIFIKWENNQRKPNPLQRTINSVFELGDEWAAMDEKRILLALIVCHYYIFYLC